MLVNSFNLSQSFNYSYTPYLFYKKWFKTEISCFCIRTKLDLNLAPARQKCYRKKKKDLKKL